MILQHFYKRHIPVQRDGDALRPQKHPTPTILAPQALGGQHAQARVKNSLEFLPTHVQFFFLYKCIHYGPTSVQIQTTPPEIVFDA